MNSLKKMTLVIGALAVLSTAALAIRCPCVTLGKDTCGGCPDSNCDGTLCSAPLRYSQLAGWDQVVPGFSTQQFSGKFVVSEVLPASPAERAGVRVGDE